jgi:hypothetical protein
MQPVWYLDATCMFTVQEPVCSVCWNMYVSWLSYYYLPTELETYFRYCSIFSQDFTCVMRNYVSTIS